MTESQLEKELEFAEEVFDRGYVTNRREWEELKEGLRSILDILRGRLYQTIT